MIKKSILVTGAAGFIGAAVSNALCQAGHSVIGLDNLNSYYPIELKKSRLKQLQSTFSNEQFTFQQFSVEEKHKLNSLFSKHHFDLIIHLAAQAGVRYSIENPDSYIDSNLVGFANILNNCNKHGVQKLVYASSSSVYGDCAESPFKESTMTDTPVSLYAATKKANELMAHSYAHLYKINTIGLRFFTVYGPWGRPDMALFKFTKSILNGEPIDVYNYGNHRRDFTYIDDIVAGIMKVSDLPISNKPSDIARVYNIGAHRPVHLLRFIEILEDKLGVAAIKNLLPMQPGDVADTYADVSKIMNDTGYAPTTSVEQGINEFVSWYLKHYSDKHRTSLCQPALESNTSIPA